MKNMESQNYSSLYKKDMQQMVYKSAMQSYSRMPHDSEQPLQESDSHNNIQEPVNN